MGPVTQGNGGLGGSQHLTTSIHMKNKSWRK